MIVSENKLAKELGVMKNTATAWRLKGKIVPIQVIGTGLSSRFLYDLDAVKLQINDWNKRHPENSRHACPKCGKDMSVREDTYFCEEDRFEVAKS